MPCKGPLPQPGDLIEFDYAFYHHWGVCVADGKVVHLTDPNGLGSFSTSMGAVAVVKEESLEFFGYDYKVNNKYDKKADPYPPGKIVNAARMEVGKIRRYDVRKANCEHFVTELRYGTPFCEQVEDAQFGSSLGAGFLAAILGAAMFLGRLVRSN
ncbi:phospholipase A and acyltransferase 3-like isoform X1 [Ranitomeya imitator]|uniref:phospholipase A and acyltransferase 3-like isoform X1 n=1 Tax=Ranitomeya imitator TaxID=111125 RepID=UPI001AA9C609